VFNAFILFFIVIAILLGIGALVLEPRDERGQYKHAYHVAKVRQQARRSM
jgi:hypothetical protein